MSTSVRNRDGLYVQLQELLDERRGISPKLGLYATLSAKIEVVQEQLGGNTIERHNLDKGRFTTSLNGARIALHEGAQYKPKKPKDYASANMRCTHRTKQSACPTPFCQKLTRHRGKCKSCKKHKYSPACKEHATQT